VRQLHVNEMFHWSIKTGAAHFILFPGLQNKTEVNKIILKKSSTKLTNLFRYQADVRGEFQKKQPLHLPPVDIFISFT